MTISRRNFLKLTASAGGAAVVAPAGEILAAQEKPDPSQSLGCLVDIPLCDGCRSCEKACNEANRLPAPDTPFEDRKVLATQRRPSAGAFTVVNRYDPGEGSGPVHVKTQCMHCNDPACASACLVGALRKQPNGAVTYDASKCMGCRYCMVACPFGIPAYEYADPVTPRVRKCSLCYERIRKEGGVPACAAACPKEAIAFGKRTEILALARERISNGGSAHRKRAPYVRKIYGEKEVGGTGWVYISAVPFELLGFLGLPKEAPPRLTEGIQHGIFRMFAAPIALVTILGMIMHLFRERAEAVGGEGAGN